MTRFSTSLGATLGVALVVSAGARAQTDPMAAARNALDAGEPRAAVVALTNALDAAPNDADLRAELALAQSRAASHDEALRSAQAAVAARRSARTLAAMALVRAARNEMPQAQAALDEGASIDPSDPRLLVAKGQIDWRLMRTASAVEALQKASASGSTAGEAQYWLGRIFAFKGWQAEGAFPGWHEEVEYRPRALAAYRAAMAARPAWYAPHVATGEAMLMDGDAAGALASFDAAIQRGANVGSARLGRWKALKALDRSAEARAEIDAAARSANDRLAGAAREGYVALGLQAEADAVGSRIETEFPGSPAAASVLADRIAAAASARQPATVIELARRFLGTYPSSPRALGVYDHLIAAYQASPSVALDEVAAAVEARAALRPDPAAFYGGAGLLLARQGLLDRATRLAGEGAIAGDRFITENLGSYKMDGKVQGSRDRTRATAADLLGWAAFLAKDLATAETRLVEADRLSRGLDLVNQFHLGELARARGDLDRARERYLNALTLSAGPPPIKEQAKKQLADVYARLGNDPAEFEKYLAAELDRRREERRVAMLESMVGKSLPALTLTSLDGRKVDLLAERGNVMLLNFFASW